MAKTQVTTYIESSLRDQAKAQGINISYFLTAALEVELGIKRAKDGRDAVIEDLKMLNIKIAESNRALKKELDTVKKELEHAKKKAAPKVLKTMSFGDEGVCYES